MIITVGNLALINLNLKFVKEYLKVKHYKKYLKLSPTKKLNFSDETINRLVWEILRQILVGSSTTFCDVVPLLLWDVGAHPFELKINTLSV